jgi:hypothetical protein
MVEHKMTTNIDRNVVETALAAALDHDSEDGE